jgi:hypothetical protein
VELLVMIALLVLSTGLGMAMALPFFSLVLFLMGRFRNREPLVAVPVHQ